MCHSDHHIWLSVLASRCSSLQCPSHYPIWSVASFTSLAFLHPSRKCFGGVWCSRTSVPPCASCLSCARRVSLLPRTHPSAKLIADPAPGFFLTKLIAST